MHKGIILCRKAYFKSHLSVDAYIKVLNKWSLYCEINLLTDFVSKRKYTEKNGFTSSVGRAKRPERISFGPQTFFLLFLTLHHPQIVPGISHHLPSIGPPGGSLLWWINLEIERGYIQTDTKPFAITHTFSSKFALKNTRMIARHYLAFDHHYCYDHYCVI